MRDMERDIIPMCRNNGMSIGQWSYDFFPCVSELTLMQHHTQLWGQGKFKTAKELESAAALRGGTKPTENELKVGKALEEVAEEIGPDIHLAHG